MKQKLSKGFKKSLKRLFEQSVANYSLRFDKRLSDFANDVTSLTDTLVDYVYKHIKILYFLYILAFLFIGGLAFVILFS